MVSIFALLASAALANAMSLPTSDPLHSSSWGNVFRRDLASSSSAQATHLDARQDNGEVLVAFMAAVQGNHEAYCPASSATDPDAKRLKPLATSDLAIVQNAIMQMCDSGKQVDPSVGGQGVTQESNGVTAQLCNFLTTEINCSGSDVQALLNEIHCGSTSSPTKGYAAKKEYYIGYSSSDDVETCKDVQDFAWASWLGSKP